MLAHRIDDALWILLAARGGDGEARISARHSLERHPENHDAATIHGLGDLPAGHSRPQRDLVQDRALHVVLATLVTARRPTLLVRHRQHRRVLARAVVVDPCRSATRLPDDLGAALRRGFVRPTSEIAFLEAEVAQHPLDDGDVLPLAAM